MRAVPVPVDTRLGHDVGNGTDVVGSRNDVHCKSTGQMPCYVAVEGPDAGVVGLKLHGGEASGADSLDVAAGGILRVDSAAVPSAGAFVEDVEVVAVKMEAGNALVLISRSG